MGSDTLLVARADSTPSWTAREGDRRLASGRPSIPAAWLALFDAEAVRMAGSKPKFVALVTERRAGLARLAARREPLLRMFPTLGPQLAAFEQMLTDAPEEHLQVMLDQTYIDWTKAKMAGAAKQLIRTTDGDDLALWRGLFSHFDGEHVFEDPAYVVGALRGWLTDEPDLQQAEYPAETTAALAELRARLFPREDPAAARAERVQAVDAMRVGVLQAPVFRHEIDPGDSDDLALFARASLPGDTEPRSLTPDPLTREDRTLLQAAPLLRDAETRLLADPATHEPTYHLANLAPALFRGLRGALVAGGDTLPGDRYAAELLGLLGLLGGDAEVGVLTMIAGRERDDDGSFGRALAWLHAYGVWAVATLERGVGPWTEPATAAPLLVLARFGLRLRALWDPAVDLEAPRRRFPGWTSVPGALLEATSRRAEALADFVAACEAPDAPIPRGPGLAAGTIVLQKRRGVTVALATHLAQVTVASFAHPERPYPRVAAAFVTPLVLPTNVGRVFLGVPRGAA
jgi:hypothetical protein